MTFLINLWNLNAHFYTCYKKSPLCTRPKIRNGKCKHDKSVVMLSSCSIFCGPAFYQSDRLHSMQVFYWCVWWNRGQMSMCGSEWLLGMVECLCLCLCLYEMAQSLRHWMFGRTATVPGTRVVEGKGYPCRFHWRCCRTLAFSPHPRTWCWWEQWVWLLALFFSLSLSCVGGCVPIL